MFGIISVTESGDMIAKVLNNEFKSKVYLKDEVKEIGLKTITEKLFSEALGIIFISSTGIAVRAIAPFIECKTKDPAIVVVDSIGKYAISLLSGHLGGGNELAEKVSKIINAKSIITTATDMKNLVAPDIIALKNNLIIEDLKKAKDFSAKLIENKEIEFFDDNNKIKIPKGYKKLSKEGENLLWVTNKINSNFNYKNTLRLIRKNIVLGIGCKKNFPKEEMKEKVLKYLEENNIDLRAIKSIGSIDLKKNEEAILSLKNLFNCDFITFSKDEILKVKGDFIESEFVKKITGVGAVAEPSVILLGGKIVFSKEKLGGITICVGEIDCG